MGVEVLNCMDELKCVLECSVVNDCSVMVNEDLQYRMIHIISFFMAAY